MEEKKQCCSPEEILSIAERFQAGELTYAVADLKGHIKRCPECASQFSSFCYVDRLFDEKRKEGYLEAFLIQTQRLCNRLDLNKTESMILYELFLSNTYSQNMSSNTVVSEKLSLAQEFYDLLEVNLPVSSASKAMKKRFFYRWATVIAPIAIVAFFSIQFVTGEFEGGSGRSSVMKSGFIPAFDSMAYTPKEDYNNSKLETSYSNLTMPVDDAVKRTYDLSFNPIKSENDFKIINISFK